MWHSAQKRPEYMDPLPIHEEEEEEEEEREQVKWQSSFNHWNRMNKLEIPFIQQMSSRKKLTGSLRASPGGSPLRRGSSRCGYQAARCIPTTSPCWFQKLDCRGHVQRVSERYQRRRLDQYSGRYQEKNFGVEVETPGPGWCPGLGGKAGLKYYAGPE